MFGLAQLLQSSDSAFEELFGVGVRAMDDYWSLMCDRDPHMSLLRFQEVRVPACTFILRPARSHAHLACALLAQVQRMAVQYVQSILALRPRAVDELQTLVVQRPPALSRTWCM